MIVSDQASPIRKSIFHRTQKRVTKKQYDPSSNTLNSISKNQNSLFTKKGLEAPKLKTDSSSYNVTLSGKGKDAYEIDSIFKNAVYDKNGNTPAKLKTLKQMRAGAIKEGPTLPSGEKPLLFDGLEGIKTRSFTEA